MKYGIYYNPELNKQMLVYEERNVKYIDYPYTEDYEGNPISCKFLLKTNLDYLINTIFIQEL